MNHQDKDVAVGDRERLRALYAAHGRALLGYALRRCPTREDAADLVSEVFVVAARRIDTVPHGDDARLWLFGAARRVLANQRRSAARRSRLDEALRTQGSPNTDDAAHVAVRREEHREVYEALRLLSDLDRALLTMIAWEGLTPAQVAAALRLRPAVVRVRLHRARARLRRALEQSDDVTTMTPSIQLPEADHATCS